MFYIFLLLFILLSAGLIFTVFKYGRLGFWSKLYRIVVVVLAAGILSYYFLTQSLTQFHANSITVQLINKLPFPLDFYIVKVKNVEGASPAFETIHSGEIRSDYYRIEYLDMNDSNEFWVAGFIGKKNMVYFSQHSVPNKNEDQIIEIQNYLNQSQKLSEVAGRQIESLKFENMKAAIWMTLDLLLLFLNFSLLVRRRK